MEILFPHDKFLHGEILPRNPLHQTPLHEREEVPLKTYVHPITITICKKLSKFITHSPPPQDCGGLGRPQRHIY